ncbi:MAG TPA: M28 family peptidase, partial [Candidatus Thermoplasmatota archaeon]|nr:M28 family peptidase [Candidatus Thermoplasmatota archaeon]
EAAYGYAEVLVTAADGSPAFRVPGTPAHVEAAHRLHAAMQVSGWTVAWQNLTGEDYDALDKGEASVYTESAAYCSQEDRERLAGLAFMNLVATRPAPEATERTFILGAHWDSKAEASEDPDPGKRSQPVLGANDGASGVGVLLQMMRELEGVDLPYNVQVVFFDGEDGFEDCHPLAGSLWFVHRLGQQDAEAGAESGAGGGPDGEAQRRMLLLDMVGDPDARFIREAHSVRCDAALVDLLHANAAGHGLAENFPGRSASIQDDHVPFTQAGIPAVDLIDYGRGFPPYWHTTEDTLDKLDAGMLGRVGALVTDVMQDDSFAEEWPGRCSD